MAALNHCRLLYDKKNPVAENFRQQCLPNIVLIRRKHMLVGVSVVHANDTYVEKNSNTPSRQNVFLL